MQIFRVKKWEYARSLIVLNHYNAMLLPEKEKKLLIKKENNSSGLIRTYE